MIQSFGSKITAAIFKGYRVRSIAPHVQETARRKLKVIDAAEDLEDLRASPGNRLEKLSGDRADQWSIRINDQWRICFRWEQEGAFNVVVTDYHQ